MGNMTTREQSQLEQSLITFPAHPVGYKVVVEIVRQFAGDLLDKVVRILSREFILLSQVQTGAKWLLDSRPSLPIELQQCLVHAYV